LLPSDAIMAMEREYLRFGMAGIFLARFLPGFRAVVAAFVGLVNMPWWSAFLPLTLATAIWYALITWAGARVGQEWHAISGFLGQLNRTLGLLALAGGAVITFLVLRRRRAHPPKRDRLLRAVHRALGSAAAELPADVAQDPAAGGAAVLLYELAHADRHISDEERAGITAYLRESWGLWTDVAGDRAPAPVPVHTSELASPVADRYDRARRVELVSQLYRIATSDGTLSRHEERLMHRAATLLGLSAEDLAEARRRSTGTQ